MSQIPSPAVVYGATYIVATPASDNSLNAVRARLMPIAESAGFDAVSLTADCTTNGTNYSAYGHAHKRCVTLVFSSVADQPATISEFEDRVAAALYAARQLPRL